MWLTRNADGVCSVWGYEGGLRRLVPQENNTYEYPPLYHPPGWVENNTSPVEPEKGEEQEDEQVQGPAKKDPKYTTPESKPYNPYPEFDDGYVECSYDDDDDDEEDEKSSGLKKRLVKREKPVLRVFPGIPEGAH